MVWVIHYSFRVILNPFLRVFGTSTQQYRTQNSVRNRRFSRGFRRVGAAGAWSDPQSLLVNDDRLVVFGGWRHDHSLVALGRWPRWRVERPPNSLRNRRPFRGFLRVDAFVVSCGWRCCPAERPPNFVRSTTLSWFWAGSVAGAWSVLRILFRLDDVLVFFGGRRRWRVQFLRILFVIDELPVVLGGWRCWRVERPQNSVRTRRRSRVFRRAAALARAVSPNSVRNRRASRCFGRVAVLARGASSNRRLSRGFRRVGALVRGASSEFVGKRRPSRGFRWVAA